MGPVADISTLDPLMSSKRGKNSSKLVKRAFSGLNMTLADVFVA
jgi:hypothetical protein